MIEARDARNAVARARGGGVHEHHGIAPAGYREHHPPLAELSRNETLERILHSGV
jgi:hypothetical protein